MLEAEGHRRWDRWCRDTVDGTNGDWIGKTDAGGTDENDGGGKIDSWWRNSWDRYWRVDGAYSGEG
jgi:hypothetical protein